MEPREKNPRRVVQGKRLAAYNRERFAWIKEERRKQEEEEEGLTTFKEGVVVSRHRWVRRTLGVRLPSEQRRINADAIAKAKQVDKTPQKKWWRLSRQQEQ